MRTIDIHAHVVPESAWRAAGSGTDWHGYRHEPGDGPGSFVGGGRRIGFTSPKVRFSIDERLKDMDAQGVDVQVLSIHTPFFGYHLEAALGQRLAREVNDEIAATVRRWPQRFAGLATLPMQDVKAAIDELERAVTVLGLKGAELDTEVNSEQWDEPKYLPFFKAAEAMGAVLFFHPQPQHNFLMQRTPRDGLFNSLGVILDDAIVVAILIAGACWRPARSSARASPTAAAPPATPWAASTAAGRAARKRGAFPSRPALSAPSLLRHRGGQREGAPLSPR
jgi:Predicted metal-dependent hydrolase of the TIM-barrel fold